MIKAFIPNVSTYDSLLLAFNGDDCRISGNFGKIDTKFLFSVGWMWSNGNRRSVSYSRSCTRAYHDVNNDDS